MRTRLIATAALILLLGLSAHTQQLQPAAPEPDFDKIAIKTTDLGNRIYMLEGVGGNITVAIADDGANEAFAKDGATIVAHENVRLRLAAGSRSGVTGNVVPPAPAMALPKLTYQDSMTIRLQGRSAELKHAADVHTDGDTYIYFTDANVLVAGDLAFFGRYPNIDFLYGGSTTG